MNIDDYVLEKYGLEYFGVLFYDHVKLFEQFEEDVHQICKKYVKKPQPTEDQIKRIKKYYEIR